jgi:hypothetical protein
MECYGRLYAEFDDAAVTRREDEVFVGNMLIGLREGIESCLILSILTALLIRGNRRGWIVLVRIGLGAALVVSVIAGWLLAYSNTISTVFANHRSLNSTRTA